jgi:AI-2 transport protein TqsA
MDDKKDGLSSTPPRLNLGSADFLPRLAVAVLGLLFLVLLIHVLREFKVILQPLFIAVFLGYLLLPLHHWLKKLGVSGTMAFICILAVIVAALFGLGATLRSNSEEVIRRLPEYEEKLDNLLQELLDVLPFELPATERLRIRDLPIFQSTDALNQLMGTFLDFFTAMAVTFLYLIFLLAEKITFPQRMKLAFGEIQGDRVLGVVGSINRAISEYVAVKTLISFLAGALSLVVLWWFRVDFYGMWSILIFLFNFIPYLGSLVAVALPIVLSFIQLGPQSGIMVMVLLIGIQVVLGNFVEPRMAGRRLGVSPLLILLSLSFWGLLWGIVGMILAVPLLVIIKIVLENIEATKPLAILMSNVPRERG